MGAGDIAEAIRDAIAAERAACGERLARVQAEANAIADVLDERRLTDFSDDVRMLARLADHEAAYSLSISSIITKNETNTNTIK